MACFSEFGNYKMVTELCLMVCIDVTDGTVKNTRKSIIPEGVLFVQSGAVATWKQKLGNITAVCHLHPAFFRQNKMWVLTTTFEVKGEPCEQTILSFDAGQEIYNQHK